MRLKAKVEARRKGGHLHWSTERQERERAAIDLRHLEVVQSDEGKGLPRDGWRGVERLLS